MKATIVRPTYLRKGFTKISGKVMILKPGQTIPVRSRVVGQAIKGNNSWLEHADMPGKYFWSGNAEMDVETQLLPVVTTETTSSKVILSASSSAFNYYSRATVFWDSRSALGDGRGVGVAIVDNGIKAAKVGRPVKEGVIGIGNFSEHATSIAGILGADNRNDEIFGVAPECDIFDYDFTSRGIEDVIEQISSNKNIGIINLSQYLPIGNRDRIITKLINYANDGILVLVAAGDNHQIVKDKEPLPESFISHEMIIRVGFWNPIFYQNVKSIFDSGFDLFGTGFVHNGERGIVCFDKEYSGRCSFVLPIISGLAARFISAGGSPSDFKTILLNSKLTGWSLANESFNSLNIFKPI